MNKIRSHSKELKTSDLEDSIKSLPPGEWCYLKSGQDQWVCFVNPLIDEKFSCIHIIQEGDISSAEDFISKKISDAFNKRIQFKNYENGCRLFYGASDGLPGLIIDIFKNAVITQINTAGVDKHRNHINSVVQSVTGKKNYFLDNLKYREKEFLPQFEAEKLPDLQVEENELQYQLRSEVIQKVGFYYDHRENRIQLRSLLGRLNNHLHHAVDLFCYTGAWGMNALAAGVDKCDFVDQGDFSVEVASSLALNNFDGQGSFHRMDVFKFLDEAISKKTKFDLILCDPPAFAKSHLQKDQALDGYSKLHRKVIKAAAHGALLAFSSCTHYVNHDEFQKNIHDASVKEGKKLRLVYSGIQGWDHPISSLNDRSSYIKSYFYILE